MTKSEAIHRLKSCLDCTDCLTCADHDEAIKVLLESYLKALESLEQREQGCERCDIFRKDPHFLFPEGDRQWVDIEFKFCPVCGRRLED